MKRVRAKSAFPNMLCARCKSDWPKASICGITSLNRSLILEDRSSIKSCVALNLLQLNDELISLIICVIGPSIVWPISRINISKEPCRVDSPPSRSLDC